MTQLEDYRRRHGVEGYLALYVNEPSPGQTHNAALGNNPDTGRPELWVLRPLHAGQEVLAGYGDEYERDYEVEPIEAGS